MPSKTLAEEWTVPSAFPPPDYDTAISATPGTQRLQPDPSAAGPLVSVDGTSDPKGTAVADGYSHSRPAESNTEPSLESGTTIECDVDSTPPNGQSLDRSLHRLQTMIDTMTCAASTSHDTHLRNLGSVADSCQDELDAMRSTVDQWVTQLRHKLETHPYHSSLTPTVQLFPTGGGDDARYTGTLVLDDETVNISVRGDTADMVSRARGHGHDAALYVSYRRAPCVDETGEGRLGTEIQLHPVLRGGLAFNGLGDGSKCAGQVHFVEPGDSDQKSSQTAPPEAAFAKGADEVWRRAEAGRDLDKGLHSD